ncbi:MAG: alpha-2-macroglobulin family protein, partial [Anaerolineales bacterium]
GVDAIADYGQMVVWASALQDGAPLPGVEIESSPRGVQAITGEDGLATFVIPASGVEYLLATRGADKAFLPRSAYYWGGDRWSRSSPDDELRWYVFDDRQMYRPGEEVHVKGWLRKVGATQSGDVGLAGEAVTTVRYQITGPQGNDLGTGQAEVTPLGGFDFAFSLPENANLGYAYLELQAQGAVSGLSGTKYNHGFQIQEFRRPEFEVTARNETTGPYFVGQHAVVAVEAAYYAGGPLPSAEVSWQVTSSPTNYQPPNWPKFTFGIWTPWWWYWYEGPPDGPTVQTFPGVTDASGNHYLRLDFVEAAEPRPHSVLAEATVFDVNRQAWAGTTSLMVHPADLYVGMRTDRYFVERGTPLEVELIVTDLDGNPIADRPIHVEAVRLQWQHREGWTEVEMETQDCTVGSALEPVSCSFETPIGGRYQITAEITDSMGRTNRSRITRWVSGGELAPSRRVEQEEVTLIPDKETYQPGEVAEILVQSPFTPAEGLLTVSRSGILYTERFEIQDGTATLEVPIEEAHIPNLQIQVDLVGSAPRTDDLGEVLENVPPRPAYARGQLNLSIPPLERTLSLQVKPRETELAPAASTTIDLVLQDAAGKPVADAEIAVVVVDEAVLALTNYQLTDPIAVFYRERPSGLISTYGRASIVLVDPMALLEAATAGGELLDEADMMQRADAPMEAGMEPESVPTPGLAAEEGKVGAEEPTPIQVRMDFNPLATFAPVVRTDAAGEASVLVELPDNLTRYRIMVVAVDSEGNRFGSAEANLTARLPLMVRPSAPRFLNFGDQFELPVVLQNQTHEPLVVEVVAEVGNLALTDHAGLRLTVPGDDRVEVRFPSTTDMAGTAKIQIAAVSGEYADAAQVELPVYTPATTEAFATYGVVDEGAVIQPIGSPEGVFPQFGGLEVQTSSTALQALTDAVLYLVNYRFECTEQLSSRILGVAALRDVLTAFEAEGLPSPEAIEAAVQRDITRLEGMQNYDGGFPYWRRGQESIPYNTIHAAHALQRAKLKGFKVPEEMQERVLYYLRDIESHYPPWYSTYTRRTLSSYALFVRNLMGDRDTEKTRRLLNEAGLDGLSLDAIGWIWQVLVDDPGSATDLDAIRRYINNRVVETAGAANFTIHYHDQVYLLLSSNRRTDAILLDAMIADDPESDLIFKLVNGLLAHRTRGRWGNTQENVFVLLALDRYFNTFEAQTPEFVARIWLGETYAGVHEYSGRTTERHETEIPMVYLVDEALGGGETQDLVLSKEGVGRLYYRLGLRYAPTDLDLDPLDMGFVVQRRYEAVDDPEDVTQDADGVWHIAAGARVRVRLTMVADNRRYHVALIDPLPAGLEIINPALAVSGSVPQDPDSSEYRYGWWWWWTWYEHQNMRDERAEAFSSLLWDGVYDYTYVARATTPGTFVVPPAKAEEMYSPEVFGRSGGDVVIVE